MSGDETILFSSSNLVERATLASSATPVTPLEWLRGPARARLVRWTALDAPLVISGTFAESEPLTYFAIPGSTLSADARVRLRLLDAGDAELYDSGFLHVGDFLPAGLFRAGVDAFGVRARVPNNTVLHRFARVLGAAGFELTLEHNLDAVTPEEEGEEPTTVSDGVHRQDETSGVLSIEAESGVAEAAGSDAWALSADAAASGGTARAKTGPEFYWTAQEGPLVRFAFTASASGAHAVWLRLASTDGNSIYTSFGDEHRTSIFPIADFANQGYLWKQTMTVNLTAGARHEIVVSARDHYLILDKLVVQPAGAAAPTGTGPAESAFGEKLVYSGGTERVPADESLDVRMIMLGDTLQLERNFAHGSPVRFLTDPDFERAASGYQTPGRPQRAVRRAAVSLPMMSETDRLRLLELELERAGRPVIVSLYPSGTEWTRDRHTFLARLGTANDYAHTHPLLHSTELLLHEA